MPGSDLGISLSNPATVTYQAWASEVKTALETIIADIENTVSSSIVDVNSNIDLNNFALTDGWYFQCRTNNSTSIPANGIGMKNGDWYAADAAGNQVRLTASGALAFAAAGQIGGDYVADGALLSYSAGTYTFYDGASALTDIEVSQVSIGSTVVNDGGGAYTLTLPSAVPANNAVLRMNSAGTLNTSGNVLVGFTMENADLTFTGTSEIVHPSWTYVYSPSELFIKDTTGTSAVSSVGQYSATGNWDTVWSVGRLMVNDRLRSVKVHFNKGDASLLTLSIYSVPVGGAGSLVDSNTSIVSGTGTLTTTVTTPASVAAGTRYYIVTDFTSGTNVVHEIDVTFDHT